MDVWVEGWGWEGLAIVEYGNEMRKYVLVQYSTYIRISIYTLIFEGNSPCSFLWDRVGWGGGGEGYHLSGLHM